MKFFLSCLSLIVFLAVPILAVPVSRYEMAVSLDQLGQAEKFKQSLNQKLVAELQSEVALIAYNHEEAKNKTQFSGSLQSFFDLAAIPQSLGRMSYRLKTNYVRNFDEQTNLVIGFDSLDAGYGGQASRNLATEMLNFSSTFNLGAFTIKTNVGPGWVEHRDVALPSLDRTVFEQPRTGVYAKASINNFVFSLADEVLGYTSNNTLVGTSLAFAKLGLAMPLATLYFKPSYISNFSGDRQILNDLAVNFSAIGNSQNQLLLSLGSISYGQSALYFKLQSTLKDPLKTGTELILRLDKVGSNYRRNNLDQYQLIAPNNFNRYVLDGTIDLGWQIKQKVNSVFSLDFVGDYVTTGAAQFGSAFPGTYLLWQLGLTHQWAENIIAKIAYRTYNVPSAVDQFSASVPKVSDTFSFCLTNVF